MTSRHARSSSSKVRATGSPTRFVEPSPIETPLTDQATDALHALARHLARQAARDFLADQGRASASEAVCNKRQRKLNRRIFR